jgi:hypothetical protein
MARTATAQTKSAPAVPAVAAITTAEARDMYDAALADAQTELAALDRQEREIRRDLLSDPAGTRKKLGEIAQDKAGLQSYIAGLASQIEQAAADARVAVAKAQLEASAADRAAVVRVAQERVALGQAIDDALTTMLAAVVRYREASNAITGLAQRSLQTLHAGNELHLGDALTIALPRTSGAGPDVAVAAAHGIRRLIATLGSPHLQKVVELDPFLPRGPTTLAAAAQADADWLQTRFGSRR